MEIIKNLNQNLELQFGVASCKAAYLGDGARINHFREKGAKGDQYFFNWRILKKLSGGTTLYSTLHFISPMLRKKIVGQQNISGNVYDSIIFHCRSSHHHHDHYPCLEDYG